MVLKRPQECTSQELRQFLVANNTQVPQDYMTQVAAAAQVLRISSRSYIEVRFPVKPITRIQSVYQGIRNVLTGPQKSVPEYDMDSLEDNIDRLSHSENILFDQHNFRQPPPTVKPVSPHPMDQVMTQKISPIENITPVPAPRQYDQRHVHINTDMASNECARGGEYINSRSNLFPNNGLPQYISNDQRQKVSPPFRASPPIVKSPHSPKYHLPRASHLYEHIPTTYQSHQPQHNSVYPTFHANPIQHRSPVITPIPYTNQAHNPPQPPSSNPPSSPPTSPPPPPNRSHRKNNMSSSEPSRGFKIKFTAKFDSAVMDIEDYLTACERWGKFNDIGDDKVVRMALSNFTSLQEANCIEQSLSHDELVDWD